MVRTKNGGVKQHNASHGSRGRGKNVPHWATKVAPTAETSSDEETSDSNEFRDLDESAPFQITQHTALATREDPATHGPARAADNRENGQRSPEASQQDVELDEEDTEADQQDGSQDPEAGQEGAEDDQEDVEFEDAEDDQEDVEAEGAEDDQEDAEDDQEDAEDGQEDAEDDQEDAESEGAEDTEGEEDDDNEPRRASARGMPPSRRDRARKIQKKGGALNEIRTYQRSYMPLIPRAPLIRLIREYTRQIEMHEFPGTNFQWKTDAIQAVSEAADFYLTEQFQNANLATLHAKRVTVQTKDFRLAVKLSHPNGPSDFVDVNK